MKRLSHPLSTSVRDWEGALPKMLIGDSTRLKQVLVNLTKNALKFSYRMPITVKACFDVANELLVVHVVDNGVGIEPNDLQKLRNYLCQEEDPDAGSFSCDGMGLTVCKKIVEHTGGTIDCYSEGKGHGCTVMFSMKMSTSSQL